MLLLGTRKVLHGYSIVALQQKWVYVEASLHLCVFVPVQHKHPLHVQTLRKAGIQDVTSYISTNSLAPTLYAMWEQGTHCLLPLHHNFTIG